MRHLAETPAFEGIGYTKAARLVETFDEELPRLLADGDPLPFVPVVGERAAATLVAALPMLLLFMAFARRIVNSIGFTGIK